MDIVIITCNYSYKYTPQEHSDVTPEGQLLLFITTPLVSFTFAPLHSFPVFGVKSFSYLPQHYSNDDYICVYAI
jgi:hypothetical protein